MPNSRVLSVTDISIVFITLNPPMIAARIAELMVTTLKISNDCPACSFNSLGDIVLTPFTLSSIRLDKSSASTPGAGWAKMYVMEISALYMS